MTAAARAAGEDLIVVTSRSEMHIDDIPIKNFRPIGEFELPEYELQKLSFPPILQMLDYIQREEFTEIIISTPGPIGLTALLAAKMLNLQTSGIYHTDFPQYIRILTDDSFLESVAWNYMHWFYGQLDTVFVNSEQYRAKLDRARIRAGETENSAARTRHDAVQSGAARSGLLAKVRRTQRRGSTCFTSAAFRKKKTSMFWRRPIRQLRDEGLPMQLFVVGHGPYSAALAEVMPEAIFTGYLRGKELAAAYASADVFVFPSTTDTFGNVVIEAQASGVPVIVSDTGGPKELVEANVNGLVTKSHDVEDLARAIRDLVNDKRKRDQMSRQARQAVIDRSWPGAFRKFWAATEI